jgi:excisionase family DNA binding protein
MEQRVLTVAEVMTALVIGRDKVYDLIRSGELESVKVGRYRRVPIEAFDAYLAGLSRDVA